VYTYNAANRLASYRPSAGGALTEYRYNGLGERVFKNRSGSKQRFVYDGNGLLLHERGSMGTRDYIYLNGEPVVLVKNGDLYFIHNDHLGRPEAASDANGVSAWSVEANAWSSDTPIGSLWAFNLRFPGQYFDVESGNYYNYYRTYDPSTGRYLESDSIGLGGGLNTYGYVAGNPLRFVDPLGRDAIYINYDYYPISTPIGNLPLGHGAVVAVDPETGTTKYYEFGRYGDNRGIVQGAPDIKIPDVDIGDNGLPTQESLDELYEYLSEEFGKGSRVSATYYEDSDFQGTVDFAKIFRNQHPDYSLISNNCKTFGRAAATACKEGEQCQ